MVLLWTGRAPDDRYDMGTAALRIEAWQTSIDITSNAPWYNILLGYGNFPATFDKLANNHQPNRKRPWNIGHSHNILVQVVIENGLIGLALLTYIWWKILAGLLLLWKTGPSEEGNIAGMLLVVLLSVMSLGVADNMFHQLAGSLGFMFLGMAASLALLVPPGPARQVGA
jgi:O-antigen ligase